VNDAGIFADSGSALRPFQGTIVNASVGIRMEVPFGEPFDVSFENFVMAGTDTPTSTEP